MKYFKPSKHEKFISTLIFSNRNISNILEYAVCAN